MTVGLVTVTLFVYNMQRSCRQFYISCIVACRVVYTVGIYSVYAWSPLKFVHFNTSTRKYIFIIADELYSLVLIIVCRCCISKSSSETHKEKISWLRKTVDSNGIWMSHLRQHRPAALYISWAIESLGTVCSGNAI